MRSGSAMRGCLLAAVAAIAFASAASGQDAKPDKVRLAVGGKPALFYLPLTVTERLG